MKTFLVIACFIALTVADREFVKNAHKECSEEAKITSEDAKNGDVKDAKYQQYSACMLTKFQILKDGVIDTTSAKDYCKKKEGKDCSFIDECAGKKGDSNEETYAIIYKCLMSNWRKGKGGEAKSD